MIVFQVFYWCELYVAYKVALKLHGEKLVNEVRDLVEVVARCLSKRCLDRAARCRNRSVREYPALWQNAGSRLVNENAALSRPAEQC